MPESFILKGDIAYTPLPQRLATMENGYAVCEGGKVAGVFETIPERYAGLRVEDCGGQLIVPGLCDAHIHAPQFAFRGLGMDLELMDWLNARAFPEELRYADLGYASLAYGQFAQALRRSATTRAAVFGTRHAEASLLLQNLLDQTGLRGFVGKVSMDRGAPEGLCDSTDGVMEARRWIETANALSGRFLPILTPRFAPACTDALMRGLGELRRDASLWSPSGGHTPGGGHTPSGGHTPGGGPVQTHLSENPGEIALVRKLFPWSRSYADVYRQFGLLCPGSGTTVLAHCVYLEDEDYPLLRESGAVVAHCPESNANLTSGVAPVRRMLNEGLHVGLGTDIAGGFSISIFRAMSDAIQASKLYARSKELLAHARGDADKPCTAENAEPPAALKLSEAFYMGTKGANALFGKVGSFESGYAFDALALDDSALVSPRKLTIAERLERAVYLEGEVRLTHKYVEGEAIALDRA